MSSIINRLEKNIEKLNERIKKNEKKIQELREKLDAKKITRAEFNIKKRKYEDRIHGINARIRILHGGIAREKREAEKKKKEK